MANFTCLPFETVVDICNPPFRPETIQHPRGFSMTLIQEAQCIGGSKQRVLSRLLLKERADELVYAGPSSGYAQIALAYCCLMAGKKATVFPSGPRTPLVDVALTFGAKVITSRRPLNLKQAQDDASKYVHGRRGARLLPFGLSSPLTIKLYVKAFEPLMEVAHARGSPSRIWVVAGSGLIFTTLSKVFPDAELMIVQVGKKIWPDQLVGIRHQLFVSDYHFNNDVRKEDMPPYSTTLNYDAKLWPFVVAHGREGDWIWNTAGAPMKPNKAKAERERINHMLQAQARINADNKLLDMPRHTARMEPPVVMFGNLVAEGKEVGGGKVVRRSYHAPPIGDYFRADGLSNWFTEAERMQCHVNRGAKMSPVDFWSKNLTAIIARGVWTGDYFDTMATMGCYACNSFNPLILMNAIKRFFGDQRITMLDPSAGWGDRLIGACAMGVAEYVGFDPNIDLHTGYAKIVKEFAHDTKTRLLALPFKALGSDDKFDLAFTSPPFFDLEIYKHSERDIAGSYQKWLQTMYIPYLNDMVEAVKPGGMICLYVSNIANYRLADDTIKIIHATKKAQYEETLEYFGFDVDRNGLENVGRMRPLYCFKRGE